MLNLRSLILTACIGTFSIVLPIQLFAPSLAPWDNSGVRQENPDISHASLYCTPEQIENIAEAITVKVFSDRSWGSGILLQKQGQTYTIITNQHVLNSSEAPYTVQTADGEFHQGAQLEGDRFLGNDLALLQFRSSSAYPVAKLKSSDSLSPGEAIFAAGFPAYGDMTSVPLPESTELGLVLTVGEVSLLGDRPLERGYQIGYTNFIQKGMSGGPLLNHRGEVVGINGMHAYPLWGDPYIYSDGSLPTPQLRDRMFHLAFAIPIETAAELAPQFASLSPINDIETTETTTVAAAYNPFSFLLNIFNLTPSTKTVKSSCVIPLEE
ncbi:MAG: serine protease [Cyanobacteriota bacterium]|nr:serine protease [Cyanobacteriota bacterium]